MKYKITIINKVMKNNYLRLLMTFIAILFFINVNAQSGYFDVDKKSLCEASSIDFPFVVSGSTTSVPNYTQNSDPTQTS